jgi:hypothetical protein
MRVLHKLAQDYAGLFWIWPFDVPDEERSGVVEIYPSLFWMQANQPRQIANLDAAIQMHQCGPYVGGVPNIDAADAILSAAAMRSCLADPSKWTMPGASCAVQSEGWILGI